MSDREVCELLVESVVKMQTWEHIRRIENLACPDGLAVQRQVSFYELSVYMHDQLLRDTDQMSMAHGLEVKRLSKAIDTMRRELEGRRGGCGTGPWRVGREPAQGSPETDSQ